MDILDRIVAEANAFSPALERKLKDITKSYRHRVRIITDDEFAELGGKDDWFMFGKRQCIVHRRESGQIAIWAM